MKCLVFEPDVTGHRLQHVRHLTDALLEIGCDVILALPTKCQHRVEYQVHLQGLEPFVQQWACLQQPHNARLSTRWRTVAELHRTILDLTPDWVYVPYADGVTQAAALRNLAYGGQLGRVPIEGQIMRGKYGYPLKSIRERIDAAANRWLTRRSPWHVTHMLDPFALRGLGSLKNPQAFRLIPEPVEQLPLINRQDARATLRVPLDGRYLAFVGGTHVGKGVDLLLKAFARAPLSQSDRLLFVGKIYGAAQDLFQRDFDYLLRQGRIVLVDRYVSDHELHCGFLAADVVTVPHPRQIGSSGTLVRAAAARRPVLASNFGWIGWATDTFRLGATVDVNDIDCHAAAIATALDQADKHRQTPAAERFCNYHTIDNQKAHWVAAIGQQRELPLGQFAQRLDWSTVIQ